MDMNTLSKQELIALVKEKDALLTSAPDAKGWVITTPNERYTGLTFGIQFHNGRAFLPESAEAEEKLRYFRDAGYNVSGGTAGEFRGEKPQKKAQQGAPE